MIPGESHEARDSLKVQVTSKNEEMEFRLGRIEPKIIGTNQTSDLSGVITPFNNTDTI